MRKILPTSKKHPADRQCGQHDNRESTAPRPRARIRTLMDILRQRINRRVHPDWFAQRIWEDDGGGHSHFKRH